MNKNPVLATIATKNGKIMIKSGMRLYLSKQMQYRSAKDESFQDVASVVVEGFSRSAKAIVAVIHYANGKNSGLAYIDKTGEMARHLSERKMTAKHEKSNKQVDGFNYWHSPDFMNGNMTVSLIKPIIGRTGQQHFRPQSSTTFSGYKQRLNLTDIYGVIGITVENGVVKSVHIVSKGLPGKRVGKSLQTQSLKKLRGSSTAR